MHLRKAVKISSIIAGNILCGDTRLINVGKLLPSIKVELAYTQDPDPAIRKAYSFPENKQIAYVHEDTAQALIRVVSDLAQQGYGLIILDAYRPLPVQQAMWDALQDERYVSNPAKNKGRHTRGTAVDVMLYHLATGKILEGPSAFDEFTERAHADYEGELSLEARTHRSLLKEVMEKNNFCGFPTEWWHFDLKGWNNDTSYPPLSITFKKLAQSEPWQDYAI